MMGARVDAHSLRRERFFHLEGPPEHGRARLCASDARHAERVLRLRAGDELWGGDGAGTAWPLAVAAVGRDGLDLAVVGPPWSEPAPGERGSRAPCVEVVLALPRGGRSEAALERLTQLGAAGVSPLESERVQGHRRESGRARAERYERVLAEACKQARRLWTPRLGAPRTPAEIAALAGERPTLVLDPQAPTDLLAWTGAHPGAGSADRPLCVVVGPEGGLTDAERAALVAGGAQEVRLGPHVLRIETAAEAAVAILVQALGPRFA